jgi:molecular chaperone GrpE
LDNTASAGPDQGENLDETGFARLEESSGGAENDEVGEKNEMEQLKEENRQLAETAAQHQEQYLRVMADMENLRKRMNRERDEYIKYASVPLLKKVLNVLDDLERAVRLSADNQDYAALQKGLDMIYKKILDMVRDEKVEDIPALELPFDPKYHQALSVEPHENYPENTIFEEMQKGYILHGRVIRPSLVKVSG